MANYMAEVAKMLGLKIGEEFCIKEMPNIKCKMHEDGLYIYCVKDRARSLSRSREILNSLLTGEVTVERKPWKPSNGDKYWYISSNGSANYYCWNDDMTDFLTYKLGNCYRTKEEAEANRDKWAAFYASDKVLEV